jgi:hypothetical protein
VRAFLPTRKQDQILVNELLHDVNKLLYFGVCVSVSVLLLLLLLLLLLHMVPANASLQVIHVDDADARARAGQLGQSRPGQTTFCS